MGSSEKIIAAVTDKIIEKIETTNSIEFAVGAVNVGGHVVKTVVNSFAKMKDRFVESREQYILKKKQVTERLEMFEQQIKNASWQEIVEKTSKVIGFVDEIDLTDENKIDNVCVCLKELEHLIISKFNEMR